MSANSTKAEGGNLPTFSLHTITDEQAEMSPFSLRVLPPLYPLLSFLLSLNCIDLYQIQPFFYDTCIIHYPLFFWA